MGVAKPVRRKKPSGKQDISEIMSKISTAVPKWKKQLQAHQSRMKRGK